MSRLHFSHEIFFACLVLAEGDLDLSLDAIASRGEAFQERHGGYFGVSDTDLRTMLLRLVVEVKGHTDVLDNGALERASLREIAATMLNHVYVWCNDEGEHWLGAGEDAHGLLTSLADELDLTHAEAAQVWAIREQARAFVTSWTDEPPEREAVQQFMAEAGLDEAMIARCL